MASGRMINESISCSSKIANLSPKALSLFCLVLPHFSSHGKMQANPYTIKGICCPLIDWLPLEEIDPLLKEISTHTNVKYFKHTDGLNYLHSTHWTLHQKLQKDRLGADRLPNFLGEVEKSSKSGLRVVNREVEVEVEVEGEVDPKEEVKKEDEKEAEGGSVKGETTLSTIDPVVIEGQRRLEQKRNYNKQQQQNH